MQMIMGINGDYFNNVIAGIEASQEKPKPRRIKYKFINGKYVSCLSKSYRKAEMNLADKVVKRQLPRNPKLYYRMLRLSYKLGHAIETFGTNCLK